MKKLFLVLSILAVGIFAVSCAKDDPSEEYLSQAYDTLNAVISDPNNITAGFDLPTELANGVKASWASSEPGVVSIGTPSNGTVVVTVNRPAKGDGDATVTLTATLSVISPVSEEEVTYSEQWSVDLKVKEKEVEDIVIENVADILALDNEEYDGTYQVTIEDMTIFAMGGSGVVFAYDGTGIIQIYGAPDNIEQGKVYTVAGTIEWYYGIWEITDATATEQAGATAQMPTKETISSVNTEIDALIASGEHQYAAVADGNFEPVYATVTGVVYKVPGDTSSYNTFIVDTTYDTTQDWVAGSEAAPARGLMLYYGTNDFDDVRLYEGFTVTMDVVIYTYRSNNKAFAIYYVGGEDGISATLTDEEKLDIAVDALTLPGSSTEAGTLDLPTTGKYDATIAWSFTDADDANNTYVNLTTGAYTVPTDTQVVVGITATVTLGTLDAVTKTFEIKLGEHQPITIAEAKELDEGDMFKVIGIITAETKAGNTFWIQDSTGGLNVYVPYDARDDFDYEVGDTIQIVGEFDIYNGLFEITGFEGADVTLLEGDDALTMPTAFDISALEPNADNLLVHQGALVDLTGYVLKYDAPSDMTKSFNITLVNDMGYQIAARVEDSAPEFAGLVTALTGKKAGDAIDITDAIVGWYYNPQLLLSVAASVADGTAYTAAEKLATADAFLEVPEADAEVTADLTLPTTGLFGSTVAWTSSNTAVIGTDGTVVRPAGGEADATVTLGYTITIGTDSTTEKTISVLVKAEPQTRTLTTDLIISEYGEGGGYNKWIEIYNGTGAAVDLSIYSVKAYNNASTTATTTLTLTGTLADGETYVIVLDNASTVAELVALADIQDGVVNFNGDDAIGLYKNDVLLDLFGIIGEDPGDGWTIGDTTNATKDHTIVRKSTVTSPVATWDATQWDVLAKDDFTNVGTHTVE